MPSTSTVTGKLGPGNSVTSQVLTDVKRINLDCEKEILFITHGDLYKVTTYDVSAATTWTLTVSGNTYTLTVAQA